MRQKSEAPSGFGRNMLLAPPRTTLCSSQKRTPSGTLLLWVALGVMETRACRLPGHGRRSHPLSSFGCRIFAACGDANRSQRFATGCAAVESNSSWCRPVADAGLSPRAAPNRV